MSEVVDNKSSWTFDHHSFTDFLAQLISDIQTIPPGVATLIVGFVAALIAIHTIRENRRLSRERLSIEHLMNRCRDKAWVESYRIISAMHQEPTIDVRAIALSNSQMDFSKIEDFFDGPVTLRRCALALAYMLNQLEYMAVALNNDVMDEEILYKSSNTSTVTIYDISKVYIEELRTKQKARFGKSTAYENIESLVEKWKERSEKESRKS